MLEALIVFKAILMSFGLISLCLLFGWTVVSTVSFFLDTYNKPLYLSRADRAIKKAGNKYPSQPVRYRDAQDRNFTERMRRK